MCFVMIYDDDPLDKIANKHHVEDMNYAVQHTKWFLMTLGLWPCVTTKTTKAQLLTSKLLIFIPSIVIVILVVPIITHIAIRDMSSSKIIILLGPISFRFANILKNIVLVCRRDMIKLCVKHMDNDWQRIANSHDRDIMLKSLRAGHFLTLICTVSMYSSAIFYQAVMPLLRGKTLNEFNVTVRPLSFPGADIFVDLQAGYNYEIVFCGNCIAAFFLYTIATAICNLAAVLVSHACGQLQIVISRLENLVYCHNNDINNVDDRLSFIIQCHVRVLRFTSRIDEILREMCLIEVVASTLIICLLEYYCMTEWKNSSTVAIITYVLLLISLCFNIFIFCHIGELLKEQFQQVGKATYMIDWYRLPSRTGLALVMVIAMANYPRKLTAGRMMELSLYSFGSIMKTSVAYLNMLQAVAE